MEEKKYLDYQGLQTYHENLQAVLEESGQATAEALDNLDDRLEDIENKDPYSKQEIDNLLEPITDKLDNIEEFAEVNVQSDWNQTDSDADNYIKNKPTSMPASDVSAWAKAANKPSYTASEVGAIASTEKGANNGVAELDASGKVPSSQLPSYVDDVLEYNTKSAFPATGEDGKIYVDKSTNTTWRWSGTTYTQIKGDLTLGETSSTAYAGDKGKALANKLATIAEGAQVNVQSDWNAAEGDAFIKNKPTVVSDAAYDTINKKITKTINGTTSDVVTSEKVVEDGGGMNLVEGYYYDKKFYKEATHTTEITGANGRIYIDKDTNREYRFDGTKYVLLKSEVDGSFVSEGTFTYRPTAGALDVESGAVGEGGAQIECVKGNTVAWNQLIENGDFSTHFYWMNLGSASINISNNECVITFDVAYTGLKWHKGGSKYYANHKYYISSKLKGKAAVDDVVVGISQGDSTNAIRKTFSITTSYQKYSFIGSEPNEPSDDMYLMVFRTAPSSSDTLNVKECMVIDLTLIYGAGNEPSTPEAFEADYEKWFGKPLGYEEYDEGSLRSVEMSGIKTVGFNLWDEETQLGWYSNEDGSFHSDSGQLCSKNKIFILPNTTYYYKNPVSSGILFYDNNDLFIGSVLGSNIAFTTPSNARYIRFNLGGLTYGTTYNHDICINIHHSGARDGEYEPYWEHTANLSVTQLKGKLNGEGESVVIFPDGMKKAGTVYDEIVKRGNQTVAIKRVGSVDLGTLTWSLAYSQGYPNLFESPHSGYNAKVINNLNFASAKYDGYKGLSSFEKNSVYTTSTTFRVNDMDFISASDFNAYIAENHPILYYELETPQEYIIDDIDFPTEYPVDDYGTEEILSDSAKSLAPTLDIRYGLNATDTLRNLPSKYVSAVEEQNFTEAQKARARKNIGIVTAAALLDENGHVKAEQLEAEYPNTTVGNIVGEFSDTGAEFAYRPSAGAVDIESGYKVDHGGHLEAIKGNTIPWNQLIQNGDFSDGTNGWSYGGGFNAPTVSGGVLTFVNKVTMYNKYIEHDANIVIGHKYLYYFYVSASLSRVCYISFSHDHRDSEFIATTPTLSLVKGFAVATYDEHFEIQFSSGEGIADETFQFSKIMLFDLTLIYGVGNEPTTVAQFESDYMKWFGKPLTYEEYDEGSLRPVKMTGLKTVGFNQYDISKEPSNKNCNKCTPQIIGDELILTCTSSGDMFWGWGGSGDGSYSEQIYGHAYRIIGGQQYELVFNDTDINRVVLNFWDSNYKHVPLSTVSFTSVSTFTTLPTACYVTIRVGNDSAVQGTVYRTKIALHLSHSGDKDGEYEPYWSSTLNVPITSLTGKLNGEGSSVVVFPDGMKKAGTAYDEIVRVGNVTKAIKRVGSVDLGTANITYNSAYKQFYIRGLVDCKKGNQTLPTWLKTALYTPIDRTTFNDTSVNKVITIDNGTNGVHIRDLDYDNVDAFKAARLGQYLYYQLAEPEEYILDDFELPQEYDVDDWGTEEILLGENGCAPVLDLKYGINAGDTIKNLPHNYVSAVSEQNFTDAQKARARKNIGAIEKEQLDALTRHTRKSDFSLDVLKQAVADGNLEKYGLKVGDQKTINGRTYVIAGLNPMKGTKTPYRLIQNHVGLIVIPHTTHAWNASGSTSQGADDRGAGYMNSDLHYYLKNTLLQLVETDLGAANLLGHSKLLSNAVTDGKSSNWTWETDCKICALSEVQVYGATIWSSSGYNTGEACRQLDVFRHYNHTEIFGGEHPWLRDVVSASLAVFADQNGIANRFTASNAYYVAALILFN